MDDVSRRGGSAALAIAAGILGAAGCRVEVPALDIGPVVEARMRNVALREFSVIGGGMGGNADLVVQTEDGSEHTLPVTFGGGTVGLGVEIVPVAPAAFEIPLRLPEAAVPASDLFGFYRGNSESIAVIGGVSARHLKNPKDVRMDSPFIPIGVSLMVGYEWLSVNLRDVVLPETGDTGVPIDEGQGVAP